MANNKVKVGVIVTNKKDKILLIKEKTGRNKKFLWNIIKGTYGDIKNETIFDAVGRESLEEAGIKIKLKGLFKCFVSQKNNSIWIFFVFLARSNSIPFLAKKESQIKRKENIAEANWFLAEDIKKMKKNDFVSEYIYKIVNEWAVSGIQHPLSIIKQIEKK